MTSDLRGSRGLGAALFLLASIVLLVSALPALVPFSPLATVGRAALAPTCHQRPERSLAVGGAPLAACARCSGLHAGGALAGLLLVARPRTRSSGRVAALAAGALLCDVAAGTALASWDHPWLRFSSGAILAFTALPWAVTAAPATIRGAPAGVPERALA